MTRQSVSTGSPYEPIIGICRAVRIGNVIAVAGTAPLGPDGKTVGVGDERFIDPDWLVETEIDAVLPLKH